MLLVSGYWVFWHYLSLNVVNFANGIRSKALHSLMTLLSYGDFFPFLFFSQSICCWQGGNKNQIKKDCVKCCPPKSQGANYYDLLFLLHFIYWGRMHIPQCVNRSERIIFRNWVPSFSVCLEIFVLLCLGAGIFTHWAVLLDLIIGHSSLQRIRFWNQVP